MAHGSSPASSAHPVPAPWCFRRWRWEEVKPGSPGADPWPKARSGHRLVFHAGQIYLFGGYNPNLTLDDPEMADDPHWAQHSPLFNELWRFNVSARRWTQLTMHGEGPRALASHTMVSYRGRLVVYGGTGSPFGLTTSNEVFAFNLDTQHWETLAVEAASPELPPALYGQACLLDGPSLFTMGGTSGFQYHIDVHRLDLEQKAWSRLTPDPNPLVSDPFLPPARYRHELCLHQKRLLVLGGGTSMEAFGFEQIPAFNLETGLWERQTTWPNRRSAQEFPEPRRCHSISHWGDDVFLCGGFDGDAIFNQLWRLHLPTMRWYHIKCPLPHPVYFHDATVTQSGQAYIFGGVTNMESNTRSDQLYRTWLTIPSLREMAWEAVNHYCPNLADESSETLMEMGVPREFVSRLFYGSDQAG
ncbi:kelch domain-containing protein 10-like [Tigriopus californicus]|uniref:kelch domain-containing protein 10-like n=1 Tax=Tigriopus californicus TaxID=6832 RepID=UPI0027DA17A8|nr:kelch domain-containing protein 10-like [Tigriopus californicus]